MALRYFLWSGQYNLVATFGLNAEGKIATLNIDGLECERKEIGTDD
jgi:hypothetical protein